ncbi:MAG TPA: cyclic nucleotide-binding domain-containing protein [Solirubrobacteraceae bacterium]|nr:cyclic nucleotide-binding domain-containing protein [Solirubrobacteraceae bacterium]
MPGDPMARAQVSFAAMWAGESAFMVALGVVAFREGGVGAVGAVTAARMACASVLAPVLGTLADGVRRERVLVRVGMVRAAMLGCAAAATATGAPALATYGVAVIATIAMTMYRPAHSALLPTLAKSPQQLAHANAVRAALDSLSTLGGPLAAAALLAASGPSAVLVACAAASLLAGLVVVGLPYDVPPPAADAGHAPRRGVLQGFAAIADDRGLSLITRLGLVQTFTRGCLTVFAVVMAIDLLGTGDAGVGVLNAGIGGGGVLGSLFAFGLVRRGGLASWFGLGIALFGVPLVVIGLLPDPVGAVLLLGVVGIGNALIDVSGFTLLARLADEAVLARMFAGFEAILTLGFAAGGLLAPLLIGELGVRGALGAVGVVAPVAVVISWPALRRLNAGMQVRDADIGILREVGALGALPAATIEQLAAGLTRDAFAPSQTVFEEGDRGDCFYVVESGRAEVIRGGRIIRTLGRGDGFGEIALLNDEPRTATIRAAAAAPLRVVTLQRSTYLTAVTGYPASATAGEAVVTQHKAGDAQEDPAVREHPAGSGSR